MNFQEENPPTSKMQVRPAPDATAGEQISFRQIKAFLAVAEYRSLTRAAQQLHVTQSALSRTIHGLEVHVGEALLARSNKGIVLTAFGAAFMPYARRLHGCYVAALAAAAAPGASGDHFVLAGCDIVLSALLPLLPGVGSAPPGSGNNLMASALASHQVLAHVAEGQADLGLCMYGGGRDDVDSQALLSAPLGLLAAPGMRLPRAVESLDALATLPLARLADDMVLPQLLLARGVQFDAYFRSRNVSNSMLAVVAAARTGYVATIVSAVAASSALCNGMQFVPLPHLLPRLQLCLIMPPGQAGLERNRPWMQAVRDGVRQLHWLPSVGQIEPTEH